MEDTPQGGAGGVPLHHDDEDDADRTRPPEGDETASDDVQEPDQQQPEPAPSGSDQYTQEPPD
ncbi:hypothetical protein OG871_36905 [Kitasatospora sp. NBC_00374]|uniref:hypothetical protein n=1 Tax=Kitasatospora sp. NBC_00374 TaxID=2975964 RepID=UPI0030E5024A